MSKNIQHFDATVNTRARNASDVRIDPATEQKQDVSIANQTNGTQTVQIVDPAGDTNFIGAFGEQIAGSKLDDISVQFQYDQLNTDFDLNATATAVTGDGAIQSINSYAEASSATTGTATIQSRDSIRYRPGHSGFGDFTASFSGTGTGYAGSHDASDGFALKLVNDNASFGYVKGGVETGSSGAAGFDDEATWNGNLDVSTIDWTKLQIFRVTFGYLGVANPTLWIRKDKWYTLHTVRTESRLTGTHVDNPVFPMRIRAENGMTVRTGSWNGGTIGVDSSVGSRGFAFPNTVLINGVAAEQGEMTLTGTNVGTIVIFNSKLTFQSKTNKVKARLTSYEFIIDIPAGNVLGTVAVQIVGQPTLSGVPTYADINTNSSIMQYDHTPGTGASVNYASGGFPILTNNLNYVGTAKGGTSQVATIDAESIGAFAYAGDTFAIIAKDLAGNNVTVRARLNFEELF